MGKKYDFSFLKKTPSDKVSDRSQMSDRSEVSDTRRPTPSSPAIRSSIESSKKLGTTKNTRSPNKDLALNATPDSRTDSRPQQRHTHSTTSLNFGDPKTVPPLQQKINRLEAENKRLKHQITQLTPQSSDNSEIDFETLINQNRYSPGSQMDRVFCLLQTADQHGYGLTKREIMHQTGLSPSQTRIVLDRLHNRDHVIFYTEYRSGSPVWKIAPQKKEKT